MSTNSAYRQFVESLTPSELASLETLYDQNRSELREWLHEAYEDVNVELMLLMAVNEAIDRRNDDAVREGVGLITQAPPEVLLNLLCMANARLVRDILDYHEILKEEGACSE